MDRWIFPLRSDEDQADRSSFVPGTVPPGGQDRNASQGGWTLIELLLAMAVVGTLAAIAVVVYGDVLERARVVRAIADIRVVESEIAVFEVNAGRLPNDLGEIGHGQMRDPWGSSYRYLNFSTLGSSGKGQMRKDRFLVPLNSTYDLYSMGKDGASHPPLTAKASQDDVVRANDGAYVGLASEF